MRKIIIVAIAALALGTSSAAMARGGGGGGGHMGGGFGGGHIGGGFGGAHIGGGLGGGLGHIGGGLGGGLGHIGGGLGVAHLGGGLGVAHLGGGLGVGHLGGIDHSFAPHIASIPSAGGIAGAEPHTLSGVRHNAFVGHGLAMRGEHDHDRFRHRRGLYAYEPYCTYSPYAAAPYYNACGLDDEPTYD